ncbi:MAG: hypothetical protein RR356_05795 [Bacteroidales bacterium]
MEKVNTLFLSFIILSALTFSLSSCNENAYDFGYLENVEASGKWGIPLISDHYTIDEILTKMDALDYIHTAGNGSLSFVYEISKEEIIKAKDFMTFDKIEVDKHFFFDVNMPEIPGITVEYPFEQTIGFSDQILTMESAKIKNGVLNIRIETNIDQNYTVSFSTEQIKLPNGDNFSFSIPSGTTLFERNLDLSNYLITPGPHNQITFSVKMILVSTGIPSSIDQYIVNCQLAIDLFTLKTVTGKLNSYTVDFSQMMDFNLGSYNFGGEIWVYEPQLSVSTKNSFGVQGRCRIDEAAFTAPDGSSASIITTSPTYVNIPVSPNQYVEDLLEQIQTVQFNTKYNAIKVKGFATLNPEGFSTGSITIDEDATISVLIKANVPIKVKIKEAFYKDTVDFNLLDNNSQIESIDKLTLRLAFVSALPVDAYAQLYFYDSKSGKVIDSVLTQNNFIRGSYQATPVMTPPILADLPLNKINKIRNCDQLILKLKLDTQDRIVQFKSSQYIEAKIGAQFNYNHLNF